MGRPSLALNPDIQQRLLDAISAGSHIEPACAYAGLSDDSYHRARRRGEQAADHYAHPPLRPDYPTLDAWRKACRAWADQVITDAPYREFREALTRALARAEVRAVATIQAAMTQAMRPVVVREPGGGERVELVPDMDARVRAAVELLKRRYPERWSERRVLDAKVDAYVPALDLSRLHPDRLRLLDELLVEAAATAEAGTGEDPAA